MKPNYTQFSLLLLLTTALAPLAAQAVGPFEEECLEVNGSAAARRRDCSDQYMSDRVRFWGRLATESRVAANRCYAETGHDQAAKELREIRTALKKLDESLTAQRAKQAKVTADRERARQQAASAREVIEGEMRLPEDNVIGRLTYFTGGRVRDNDLINEQRQEEAQATQTYNRLGGQLVAIAERLADDEAERKTKADKTRAASAKFENVQKTSKDMCDPLSKASKAYARNEARLRGALRWRDRNNVHIEDQGVAGEIGLDTTASRDSTPSDSGAAGGGS